MSSEPRLAVTIPVARDDGTVEEVRIGYAIKSGERFILQLDPLTVGAATAVTRVTPLETAAPSGLKQGGSTLEELEHLAERSRRVLADPKRSRWHEDERQLLAEIMAELGRKRAELQGASATARMG